METQYPKEIDERVQGLIDELNNLPSVTTNSSCGGHPDSTIDQVAEGHFYVAFTVKRTRKAFEDIEIIATACNRFIEHVQFHIHTQDEELTWQISGFDEFPPDLLADEIYRISEGVICIPD